MSLGCFLAGMLAGGLLVLVACVLWAYEAMHPHDELSEVDRYAEKVRDTK